MFGVTSATAEDATKSLTASVAEAHSGKGHLAAALYNSKETWLKEAVDNVSVEVNPDGVTVLDLGEQPAGDYAIAVFYDRNDNQKLDTGMFKIPKEEFGFSNNPRITFGPPKWDKSKFTHDGNEALMEIKMIKMTPGDYKD